MKKLLLGIILICAWAIPEARAQTVPITTLTAAGTTCANGSTTAGSFLMVNLVQVPFGVASFTLSTNAGGNTISFYASGDGGAHYAPLSVTPSNSTTTVTSTTTTTAGSVWRASVGSYTNICMVMTTQASGNTLVNIYPSTASALGLGGGSGSGSGTVSGQASGVIPLGTSATVIGNQSALSDNGTTVSSSEPVAVTGAVSATGGFSSTADGTHAGSVQLIGNTAAPTLTANSFGWLGPNSASFTKWFIQPSATGPAATCIPVLGALVSSISAMTCGTQYVKWEACGSRGLGDGFNAIPAETYLQTACVNDTGVTVTISAIHCFTDNAGSSTLDVQNNAGTSFLTGVITCNATKASGGAAGTLGSTVTLASGDSANFIFVADGTSKQSNWTVTGTY